MRPFVLHPCPFAPDEDGIEVWRAWKRALECGERHGDEPWPARLRLRKRRKLPGARTVREAGTYTGRVAPPRVYKDPS